LIGVGDFDKELSNQCGRFILLNSFLVTLGNFLLSLNNVVLKLLTILLVDKHCWNSNTKAGSVIGEDHVRHIFVSRIDNDSKGSSGLLNVSDLLHLGASAQFNQIDWGDNVVWITGEVFRESGAFVTTVWV
jgi:hypothetical protein